MSLSTDALWHSVTTRDLSADGLFVYAVKSTGIYCRPTCASRRPRRDRVEFFPAAAMAAEAGYRACLRCRPDAPLSSAPESDRVRRACEAVAQNPGATWTVPRLARAGGASPAQLQRAFRRVLGLAPRDYVAACKRRRFLTGLRNGGRVTETVYESGYGSPSRAYESFHLPGMTPATYGRGGRGAQIRWMTTASPVGRILVAATPRGLCFVEVGRTDAELRETLRAEFPQAAIEPAASTALAPLLAAARAIAEAKPLATTIPVDIRGTAFQWRVWRALTKIPKGETRSYAQIADAIGRRSATRAVARACATNPIALVVPCHRVVRTDGSRGGYRWGLDVKEALLRKEQ